MVPYFLVLFLVAYVKGDSEANFKTRIIGGQKAPDGAFPWQVSLRNTTNGNMHFCGGSIIGKRWILTSAQCTLGVDASTVAVFAGSNKLSSGGKTFEVDSIIVHEKYSFYNYLNDISVIKLKTEIEYTDQIKAIQIDDTYLENHAICVVSGWGYINNQKQGTDDLQMLKVDALSPDECKNKLSSFYDKTRLCGFNKGQGICRGDKGGPLVKDNKQVGIASFYVSCGGKNIPDIYTRVSSFAQWIREKTKD